MLSLYEVLSQQHMGGAQLSDFPTYEDYLMSIHDHLVRLLNARQGGLSHLPDYGMPDLNKLYQALPYSEDDIAIAVKKIVEKYEPRLTGVHVIPLPRDLNSGVVSIRITGKTHNGNAISFKTNFKSSGTAEVAGPSSASNQYGY
ncbi:type VI secretion system baseplate subunit TssE [Marinomonas mediterranea]|jgi:type VI secretion system lysozyme-related protein|uniref:Type VI secretion system lysozyme-related protein n=1 Tax=Marinomonas mediterranea (strain ATCC 700492 / JCM 21426 / NBRC 103028 / MMB-1) TaxID=717774 RepID=F2JVZ2_MARM1|nr:type VI secretion system baseplate subunit TssE [Marinomonas mediterranea]ADZ92880.1 type VI secretion system lysozyme-related protein [Marinomonas mediterranea MMB-1]WCN10813.1 type VI secretion system baseplate subunit TssE [Marinomonas mediterranea]WCN14870.1 type VI secretion system baseplate subunit TssE [Marinomonas mediterranea]WCN18902.1 type VI secretion system baseplate subunit TssE [Marinomonas mediterranea MMB-1]